MKQKEYELKILDEAVEKLESGKAVFYTHEEFWKIVREGILAAKEYMNAEKIYIEAQCYAIGFYEKFGFQVTSEEFLEDGITHVEIIRYETN